MRANSAARSLAQIRASMARGELIEAYDLSQKLLVASPGDLSLQHLAVLALARSGAIRRARESYQGHRLGEAIDGELDSDLKIDIAALGARIAKDEALSADPSIRAPLLEFAAEAYEGIFRRTGRAYPAINAATLWLLAGQLRKAQALSKEVVKICRTGERGSGLDRYFSYANEAEANLILGDLNAAKAALAVAGAGHRGDMSALATTRRELKLICDARGIPREILAPLSVRTVIHYAGHVIGPRFPGNEEARVRRQIDESLERLGVGFGYGSLAAGSDIIFVEALLARGADVHLTLPFATAEFRNVSVRPFGEDWVRRFEKCLECAKTVTLATAGEYRGDDTLFGYADRIAMGLALVRARFLDTSVHQIAVWDRVHRHGTSNKVAGTAASVSLWKRCQLPSAIISPHRARQPVRERRPDRRAGLHHKAPAGREIRAFLFCDVKGFSQLHEHQLPAFEREVLGRFARVLAHYRKQILFRNTWGDGLYVVASDVEHAAGCALDLLDELAAFNPEEQGLPAYMGIRIGGHFGPVYRLRDPILRRWNYLGSHVSLAAMIEPVTPAGTTYVTEAFAAALALQTDSAFECEYAGQVAAAKQYGTLRMYALRRKHPAAASPSTVIGRSDRTRHQNLPKTVPSRGGSSVSLEH